MTRLSHLLIVFWVSASLATFSSAQLASQELVYGPRAASPPIYSAFQAPRPVPRSLQGGAVAVPISPFSASSIATQPDYHLSYPPVEGVPSQTAPSQDPTRRPVYPHTTAPEMVVPAQFQNDARGPGSAVEGPTLHRAAELYSAARDATTILAPAEPPAPAEMLPPVGTFTPQMEFAPESVPYPATPSDQNALDAAQPLLQIPAPTHDVLPPQLPPQMQITDSWTANTGDFVPPCDALSGGGPCGSYHGVDPGAFCPDPDYSCLPYSAHDAKSAYQGKWWNPTQRPLIELGRGLYKNGPIPPPLPILAETNLWQPHFLLFGDYRTAVAYNDNGGADEEIAVFAHRANLDFDLKLTATERLHAFLGPLDDGGQFTRAEYRVDDDSIDLFEHFDDDFDTLFFEGDLGYLYGGMSDQMAPFDLPFVVGKFPLLFQNGVWFLDVVEGFAFTLPAKNSPALDWSNFDLTFFFLFEDIDSGAFVNDEDGQAFGFNWFLEAYNGYFEVGYAFMNDTSNQGLSYHNATVAYTRRYFHRVSNSIRVIVNSGQDPVSGVDTADGTAILVENAFITSRPLVFVPYVNLFAGFGRPQQVAGFGLLTNTGINFETDGLTGFPLLDPTANDTYGGAAGVNLLGPDFSWQLLLEFATVQAFGNDAGRNVTDDQYGFGMRYQVPLTNAWILRLDSMYGIFEEDEDVRGARMELRWKF